MLVTPSVGAGPGLGTEDDLETEETSSSWRGVAPMGVVPPEASNTQARVDISPQITTMVLPRALAPRAGHIPGIVRMIQPAPAPIPLQRPQYDFMNVAWDQDVFTRFDRMETNRRKVDMRRSIYRPQNTRFTEGTVL